MKVWRVLDGAGNRILIVLAEDVETAETNARMLLKIGKCPEHTHILTFEEVDQD